MEKRLNALNPTSTLLGENYLQNILFLSSQSYDYLALCFYDTVTSVKMQGFLV